MSPVMNFQFQESMNSHYLLNLAKFLKIHDPTAPLHGVTNQKTAT